MPLKKADPYTKTRETKTKVILGDFNLDHHKKNEASYPQQRVYDELIELETAFDLHQLVREDTWSRDYNGVIRTSLLDHIYISNLQLVEQVEVKKIEISDHSVVILRTSGIIRTRYQLSCPAWMEDQL